MSGPQEAGHVFISYVREDSDRADELQRILQAAGMRVWRDTADLWPGEDWRIKIRRAIIDSALVFVACFSQRSVSRHRSYQNEELTLAIEQMRLRPPDNAWLIPVRFDDCKIPDWDIGAGRSLTSIQRADLFGDRYDEKAQQLVASVGRILGHLSTPEGWWTRYGKVVPPQFARYLAAENSASEIWAASPLIIPSLLQADEYAYNLVAYRTSDEELADRIVQITRERRERILDRPEPCTVRFFIGEAAIRRSAGSPYSMMSQLNLLRHTAAYSKTVSIKIVPLGRQAYGDFVKPLTLFLSSAPGVDLLCAEDDAFDELEITSSEKMLTQAREQFQRFEVVALSEKETIEFLEEALRNRLWHTPIKGKQ